MNAIAFTPEEFLEKLRGLRVRAQSPDRSVRVVLGFEGTCVEFGSQGSAGHTEASLGRQVAAALEAVQHGYQRAMAMFLAQASGRTEELPEEKDPRFADFAGAIAETSVESTSPRGMVRVRRRGSTGIGVEIAKGSLIKGTDGDALLLDEINAAMRGADTEYSRKYEAAEVNHLHEEH